MSNSSRNFKRHLVSRQVNTKDWPFTGNLGSAMVIPLRVRLKILFFGRVEVHMAFYLNKMAKVGPAETILYAPWPMWIEKIKAKFIDRLRKSIGQELPPEKIQESAPLQIVPDTPIRNPADVIELSQRKRGKFEVN